MQVAMQNVLIVKLSAIGDVVHALPVAQAIKEAYPSAHITWVVEPPAYDIVAGSPAIDEVIVFHKREFRSLGGFLKNFLPFRAALRQRAYDVALDLQGLFKSAAIVAQVKAKKKLGADNMREGSQWLCPPVLGAHATGHVVERYLDVARALGCEVRHVVFPFFIPEEAEQSAWQKLMAEGVQKETPYVALNVGASWQTKCWPAEYFATLSDWLFNMNYAPVLVGGANERGIAAEVLHHTEIPPANLVGQTSLKELGAILKHAKLLVSGDTGPAHLGVAVGVPCVMLMGPTKASRNGPYGQMQNVIEVNRPCRYCWQRVCPKQLDCLAAISVAEVQAKIKEAWEKT